MRDNFCQVVKHHTAGDPMEERVCWTNLSCKEISRRLADLGTPASPDVVQGLLREFGYGQRQAAKCLTRKEVVRRNEQFAIIAGLKENYLGSCCPAVSMDAKKKEFLGNLYRPGRIYTTGMLRTYDHDFRSYAEGVIIPHGFYDLARNVGHINLGLSRDTCEFACDSLAHWWCRHGIQAWPKAFVILLLCDGGGSNSCRRPSFKYHLQRIVNQLGIPVRVAHYPPYCSRFNPIDHRLFPHITRACRGVIFHNVEIAQQAMSQATTTTGLRVTVDIIPRVYEKGKPVSSAVLNLLNIHFADTLPEWNYTNYPQSKTQMGKLFAG